MPENLINGIPGFPGAKTDKNTIPTSVTKTGTITHSSATKLVVGTGTLFLSECKIGAYIYANEEIRQIVDIHSNTRLQVKTGFSSDFTAATLKIAESGIYRHVGIKNTSESVDGELFGNTFPFGETVNYNSESGLAPIVYDATGTTFLISTIE